MLVCLQIVCIKMLPLCLIFRNLEVIHFSLLCHLLSLWVCELASLRASLWASQMSNELARRQSMPETRNCCRGALCKFGGTVRCLFYCILIYVIYAKPQSLNFALPRSLADFPHLFCLLSQGCLWCHQRDLYFNFFLLIPNADAPGASCQATSVILFPSCLALSRRCLVVDTENAAAYVSACK